MAVVIKFGEKCCVPNNDLPLFIFVHFKTNEWGIDEYYQGEWATHVFTELRIFHHSKYKMSSGSSWHSFRAFCLFVPLSYVRQVLKEVSSKNVVTVKYSHHHVDRKFALTQPNILKYSKYFTLWHLSAPKKNGCPLRWGRVLFASPHPFNVLLDVISKIK